MAETVESPSRSGVATLTPLIPFVLAGALLSVGNYYDSDEGVILNGAWKLLNGESLYRDFFSFVAPGSYLWVNLAFSIFGASYTAARIAGIALLLASVGAIYETALYVSAKKDVAFLSAAIWMIGSAATTVIVNHNPLSSYLAILAVYSLLRAVRRGSSWFYAAAGFFLGAVGVFLQTKGVALAAAFAVALVYCGMKRTGVSLLQVALLIVAASMVPVAVTMLWPPRLLWHALVEWPAGHYSIINRVSHLPLVGTVLAFSVVLFLMWRSETRNIKVELWIVGCVQAFLFLATLSRPDMQHIFWSSFPMIILIPHLLHELALDSRGTFRIHPGIVFYRAPAVFLVLLSLALAIVAMRLERDFGHAIAEVRGEKIYAHPFLPGLYLELRAPDHYPYYALFETMHSREAFAENLRVLRRERPRYVFTDYAMVEKFGYRRQNELDEYLLATYMEKASFGPIRIWERKRGDPL